MSTVDATLNSTSQGCSILCAEKARTLKELSEELWVEDFAGTAGSSPSARRGQIM